MVLLVSQAKQIVEHALGGPVSEQVTAFRCLNGAGHWLCNARGWRWLRGGLDTLTITSGEPYVALPADFASIAAIEGGQGFPAAIDLVTLDELLEYKSNATGVTGFYYAAVVGYDHADITGTSTGTNHPITASTAAEIKAKKFPTPRLELFPTPTSTSTDGILLYYTRGWREVDEDTDTIFIPDWMEELYLDVARCWARRYEEEDNYDHRAALANIRMGPEYLAAVRRDGSQQINLGPVRGGAAQEGTDRARLSRFYGVIPNP